MRSVQANLPPVLCIFSLLEPWDASRCRKEGATGKEKVESGADKCERSQPTGARNQAAVLEGEGVTVTTGALGELMVDFAEFGWFPRVLPSEAGMGLEDEDEDGEGEESDDEEIP